MRTKKAIADKDIAWDEYYQAENPAQDFLIIFLHGLGADSNDFAFLYSWLKNQGSKNWCVALPNAPHQPITVNNGYEMRAWYDIYAMDLIADDDRKGMSSSVDKIDAIIDYYLKQGFDEKRLFIGGFSQGGVISLLTLFESNYQPAGVLALSTYLPFSIQRDQIKPQKTSTAVFMAHGQYDPVVPYSAGEKSCRYLEVNGSEVEWHDYPLEHSLNEQEIEDMLSWLGKMTK